MAKRGAPPEPSRTARSTLALGTPDNDAARPCTSSSPGKRERRGRDTGVPGCCQRVPPRAGSSLAVHSGRLTAARSHLRSTITTHARSGFDGAGDWRAVRGICVCVCAAALQVTGPAREGSRGRAEDARATALSPRVFANPRGRPRCGPGAFLGPYMCVRPPAAICWWEMWWRARRRYARSSGGARTGRNLDVDVSPL